jgi:hypothetical protein
MEALLFLRGKRDGEAQVGAAFLSRALGSGGRARALFGGEAEGGGEEEQGEVLHDNDVTTPGGMSFVYFKDSLGLGNLRESVVSYENATPPRIPRALLLRAGLRR